MGEGRVFVGRVVGAYAHPPAGQAPQQPRRIVHRDAEEVIAPPVHGLRHDIERKSAPHFRPKPLDRRDEERPHLALAQPEPSREEAVHHQVVARDRAEIRIRRVDIDLDERRVGEPGACVAKRLRRAIGADIGDVLQAVASDMRQKIAGAAGKVAEHDRRFPADDRSRRASRRSGRAGRHRSAAARSPPCRRDRGDYGRTPPGARRRAWWTSHDIIMTHPAARKRLHALRRLDLSGFRSGNFSM